MKQIPRNAAANKPFVTHLLAAFALVACSRGDTIGAGVSASLREPDPVRLAPTPEPQPPLPAALSVQPPSLSSETVSHFEFASPTADSTYLCALDGAEPA
ncbi:MAG TPA: hypothetical protein VFV50_07045, partial [Bdellovibrionales bacterium]|nr:hypothetical protein [Bdellovibrionales bacterium]